MRGCLQAAVFSNFLNFGGYIEVTVGLFRMSLHKLRPEYCTAENKKSHFFPGFLLVLVTPENRRCENWTP